MMATMFKAVNVRQTTFAGHSRGEVAYLMRVVCQVQKLNDGGFGTPPLNMGRGLPELLNQLSRPSLYV